MEVAWKLYGRVSPNGPAVPDACIHLVFVRVGTSLIEDIAYVNLPITLIVSGNPTHNYCIIEFSITMISVIN